MLQVHVALYCFSGVIAIPYGDNGYKTSETAAHEALLCVKLSLACRVPAQKAELKIKPDFGEEGLFPDTIMYVEVGGCEMGGSTPASPAVNRQIHYRETALCTVDGSANCQPATPP